MKLKSDFKCDHTSVGILVWKNGKLLLIERKNFPFGFAPPAGHLDGDSYEEAAKRELKEEVGLDVKKLKLVFEEKANNACKRIDGDWHYWKIYGVEVVGNITRSLEETKKVGWYDKREIVDLINRTNDYSYGKMTEKEWQENPGIETVWVDWFKKLKII